MNRDVIKKFLIPTPFQAAISLLLSCLIMVWVFHNAIAATIIGGTHLDPQLLRTGYQDEIASLTGLSFAQTLALAFFWAAVGLGAYLAYLLIANSVIAIANRFILSTSYINRGRPDVSRPLIRLGLLILLVVLAAVTIKWLFPGWIALVGQFIPNFRLDRLPLALAVLTGQALNIYVLWMIGDLALHPTIN